MFEDAAQALHRQEGGCQAGRAAKSMQLKAELAALKAKVDKLGD